MNAQLPLALGLKDSAGFASFISGANAELVAFLQSYDASDSATPLVYLWGDPGSGKTHLLQALCQAASERDDAAVYLPMCLMADFPQEALLGLEEMTLICIDDLDVVAGNVAWEDALLRLFVRAHSNHCLIAMAGSQRVTDLGLKLPQLVSRLQWGLAFQVKQLTESDKLHALELRAQRRGVQLPLASARYLVKHYGAATEQLFAALEQLDQASMVAKRRLTIPFIRSVLQDEQSTHTVPATE